MYLPFLPLKQTTIRFTVAWLSKVGQVWLTTRRPQSFATGCGVNDPSTYWLPTPTIRERYHQPPSNIALVLEIVGFIKALLHFTTQFESIELIFIGFWFSSPVVEHPDYENMKRVHTQMIIPNFVINIESKTFLNEEEQEDTKVIIESWS